MDDKTYDHLACAAAGRSISSPNWRKAQILLVGAILAPGQRTVAAVLRVMGRSDHRDYAHYH